LADTLENGQQIVITSSKLCYRKRTTNTGEQSGLEVLTWTAEVLRPSTPEAHDPAPEDDVKDETATLIVGNVDPVKPKKGRR
jgi:hypothetical protein